MIGEFLAAVGGHLGGDLMVPRWALYGAPLAAGLGVWLWCWAALVGERTRRLAAERQARYDTGRVRVQQRTATALTRALPTLAGSDLPPRGAAVVEPIAVLSEQARREVDEDTTTLVRQLRTGEQPETVTLDLASAYDVEAEPAAEPPPAARDEQRVAGGPPFGPRYIWPAAGRPAPPVGVPPRGYGWLSRSAAAVVDVAPRWLLAALVLAGLGTARVAAVVRPWLASRPAALRGWAALYRVRWSHGRHEVGPREASWWDVAREQSLRWAAERQAAAGYVRSLLDQGDTTWRHQLGQMRLALLPPARSDLPEIGCRP